MALTENGLSTTKDKDQFAYEIVHSSIVKRNVVYWDYRDVAGKLHTGTARTLDEAKNEAAKFGYKEV